MKIKSVFIISSFLFSLVFISCNDNLNSIGASVQPPNDTISVATDTIPLVARTISLADRIYARTMEGVLGNYEDDMFGTIKSDYLCQFFLADDAKFRDNVVSIDSTQFSIDFVGYQGDSLAPMGLSLYRVTKPLIEDFYTNIDPAEYTDMTQVLAQEAYTIYGSQIVSTSTRQRRIIADLGDSFGQSIYDALESGTVNDEESFNEFFPGMYVTTTSGSGSLINVVYTSIDIFYKYNDILGNHDNTKDTIRSAYFSLSVTPEVIQLNHIQNKNPQELFVEGSDATYIKSPAGVATEVEFPIQQIAANMQYKDMTTVNSAQFIIKGFTEREDASNSALSKPLSLLLIDKDSIDSFFTKPRVEGGGRLDNRYNFLGQRTSSSNMYSFGNISSMIKHYTDKGVNRATFVIIPISFNYTQDPYTGSTQITDVYNYMRPSTAILRNDPENMRMELVYSKF